MNKKYDLAVYIGRFQPFHNGHLSVINKAKEIAEHVLVLVGSANASKSCRNPWAYSEREEFIESSLHPFNIGSGTVIIDYLDDYLYEENQWMVDVQEAVAVHTNSNKICIIGYSKDETSYYLKNFPNWDLVDTEYYDVINASEIRDLIFSNRLPFIKGVVPEKVFNNIKKWVKDESNNGLFEEYKFIKEYKKSWAGSPYPPTFSTVDAVVIQSGHILLVQRGEQPGYGLMALPGGFIHHDETLERACIRELREETKLKVPEPVLKGSIKVKEIFDSPTRSQRGRTITTAYLIQLDNSQDLPKVKGSDDAKHAKWVPLKDFYEMPELMYEDHYHIVRKLLDNT